MKNRLNFVLYIMGGSISTTGDVLSNMGILFLSYEISKSVKMTSIVGAFETMPFIVFGLIGGVVADWYLKKELLITVQLIRIPIMIIFVYLMSINQINISYLIFYVMLLSLCSCFYNPAHRALLPQISQDDNLIKINSIYDASIRITTICALLLSGVLLTRFDLITFFIIDLFTFFISLSTLVFIRSSEIKVKSQKTIKRIKEDLLEFVKYIKYNEEIKHLFLFTFIMVFLNTWLFDVGFLMLVKQTSEKANSDFSFYKGFYSFCAIFINIFIPIVFKKQSIHTYILGSFIWGSGFFIMSLNQSKINIYFSLIIISAGLILSSMTRSYLIQTKIEPFMHARGFSFNAVLLYTSNTLSLLSFGFTSEVFNIQAIYVIASSLMMLSSISFFILRRT
ncbi:MFS transporter [Macrococcus equipercicus]|uniref:MFS transporter n=1 Tax=Macrococcus equipercicus TaxID=69967 RepID=A0A9Q9BP39_9STAP|nr:MFS transporter [Macrococcus equipercicus]UTH13111.1 MFS transporter [Macrococcus equipercicus]